MPLTLDDASEFSASEYMFVSTRLARMNPKSPESILIIQYMDPFPRTLGFKKISF
jgi:hypothetical protein